MISSGVWRRRFTRVASRPISGGDDSRPSWAASGGHSVNLASRLCDIAEPGQLLAAADDLELPEWVAAAEHDPVAVKGMADEVAVVALSPDRAVLRRKSRSRSANALRAVVEGITRPMRTWSQDG